MRVAIVHYWLLNMRGGERVVEALCRLLPDAQLFTLFYDPARMSPLIRSRVVTPSFLDPLRRWHRSLLPLAPLALESFDLRGYDLVISSESGPAKGVLTPSRVRHVCYCHTPMRYLWDLYPEYRTEWSGGAIRGALIALFSHYLRMWDVASAARVDQFVANSVNTKRRIWKTYRRRSTVIYPPVAVESFFSKPAEDYFLIVAELVAYKRIDTAVRLFSRSGRRLKIVGLGPEYRRLRDQAGPSVEFCGRLSDEELRDVYARCRAFLMPGEEDFGMTAVEALASGKPVVALGRGGAVEIVPPGGGVLYDEPTELSLEDALRRVERLDVNAAALRQHVMRFSEAEFARAMTGVIQAAQDTMNTP